MVLLLTALGWRNLAAFRTLTGSEPFPMVHVTHLNRAQPPGRSAFQSLQMAHADTRRLFQFQSRTSEYGRREGNPRNNTVNRRLTSHFNVTGRYARPVETEEQTDLDLNPGLAYVDYLWRLRLLSLSSSFLIPPALEGCYENYRRECRQCLQEAENRN